MTTSADDFLIPDPIELTMSENDPPADVSVSLDSGLARPIGVFDHHGRPLADAEVIAASGNRPRATSRTGIDGRTTIAVPAAPVTIYAIAPNGGFAVLDRAEIDRIDLPTPQSSAPR